MNADDILNEVIKGISKKPKRGKLCPNCNIRVGARKSVCECGHVFRQVSHKLSQKERDAKADQATEEEKLYAMCIGAPGGRIVYAARNRPAYDLNDISLEKVKDYCNLVVHQGIQDGSIYTVTAIKKYLQHQLEYNSEEYRQACEFVNLWYDEKMGVDSPSDCGIMGEDGDDPWA